MRPRWQRAATVLNTALCLVWKAAELSQGRCNRLVLLQAKCRSLSGLGDIWKNQYPKAGLYNTTAVFSFLARLAFDKTWLWHCWVMWSFLTSSNKTLENTCCSYIEHMCACSCKITNACRSREYNSSLASFLQIVFQNTLKSSCK